MNGAEEFHAMNPTVVMVSSQERVKCTRPLYGSPKSRETDLAHRGAFIKWKVVASNFDVKSWIMVVMNRSHALGSFAAVVLSDHTVIMSCLQGCRITLCLALRSVQTGVLIEILLDFSKQFRVAAQKKSVELRLLDFSKQFRVAAQKKSVALRLLDFSKQFRVAAQKKSVTLRRAVHILRQWRFSRTWT